MTIKLLTVDLHIPGRSSLKEKRFVLSSLKTKLARHFNIAIAEVDYHDKWQRAKLAIVTVGRDSRAAEATMTKVMDFFERDHRVTVLNVEQETR